MHFHFKLGVVMRLIQLEIGQKAVIDMVNVNGALKDRFQSIGISVNELITIKHFGLFKSTVQVSTSGSLIGLRKAEAECIDVHKVA